MHPEKLTEQKVSDTAHESKSLITIKQKTILWTIWKKQVGLEKEALYNLIQNRTGKERMSLLTETEAQQLIDFIRDEDRGSINGASHAQLYKIRQIAEGWNWTEESLKRFLNRVTHRSSLNELTPGQARYVLAAMERMRVKNESKRLGE